jgi:hypothetical protein
VNGWTVQLFFTSFFLFFFVLVLEVSSDHNQDLGFAAWNEFFRIQGFKGGSE